RDKFSKDPHPLFNGFIAVSLEKFSSRLDKFEKEFKSIKDRLHEMYHQIEHLEWQAKLQFDHLAAYQDAQVEMYVKNKWIDEKTTKQFLRALVFFPSRPSNLHCDENRNFKYED
ncbi:hypothetical protein, partial [Bacillus amyloliquefaciens]|uniref:hypothetical protein n=1 Tax=Bacillus amyloliquefaciens TaxID=1390 RepID=UPI00197ADF89